MVFWVTFKVTIKISCCNRNFFPPDFLTKMIRPFIEIIFLAIRQTTLWDTNWDYWNNYLLNQYFNNNHRISIINQTSKMFLLFSISSNIQVTQKKLTRQWLTAQVKVIGSSYWFNVSIYNFSSGWSFSKLSMLWLYYTETSTQKSTVITSINTTLHLAAALIHCYKVTRISASGMCVLKETYVNYFKIIIAFASYKVLKIKKRIQ